MVASTAIAAPNPGPRPVRRAHVSPDSSTAAEKGRQPAGSRCQAERAPAASAGAACDAAAASRLLLLLQMPGSCCARALARGRRMVAAMW